MLPVLDAVRRLHDHGIGEIHLKILSHTAVINNGSRIIYAPLVAQSVESLLHLQRMHQIVIYIRGDDILRKLSLMLRTQRHIGIAAAHKDYGLILVLRCKIVHPLNEIIIRFDAGICFVFYYPAAVAWTCGEFPEDITFDVVLFIECSGYAVCVDIPSEHYRYEFSFSKR